MVKEVGEKMPKAFIIILLQILQSHPTYMLKTVSRLFKTITKFENMVALNTLF